MDDYDGPSVYIESTWKRVSEKTDSWTITDPVQVQDKGVESLDRPERAIQTDSLESSLAKTENVHISTATVDLILAALKSNSEEPNILSRLNPFHRADSIKFSLIKQFQMSEDKDLPLHSVIAGPNGRIAFVYAERYHESWCSHNGVIVFWRRKVLDRLVLPSCPTCIRYTSLELAAVALITGEILIVRNGEVLSRNEAHDLAVTAVEWIPSKRLVSVSLDGHITVHSIKSTSLVKEHSKLVTFMDLPKRIRKTNTSARNTGLTSLCVAKDRAYVGSETGSIWRVAVNDLTLSYVKVLSEDGTTVYSVDGCISNVGCSHSGLIIYGDQQQLNAFQLDDHSLIMHQTLPHIAFTIDADGHIVLVDDHSVVSFYRISYDH